MKLYLDELDGVSTPKVEFCCRSAFDEHRMFFFNLRPGNQDECRIDTGVREIPITHCPFCGTKIQFLRNQG